MVEAQVHNCKRHAVASYVCAHYMGPDQPKQTEELIAGRVENPDEINQCNVGMNRPTGKRAEKRWKMDSYKYICGGNLF